MPNYVEPFFGSGAVLLNRPTTPGIETVNDLDCLISNFWRALQTDPNNVAFHADHPVNEADLTARHQWIVNNLAFRESMKTNPEFFDAKVAGWWVWGLSCWIGGGWCDHRKNPQNRRPHLSAGKGVHRQLPHLGGRQEEPIYAYLRELAARLRKVRVCCGDWSRVLGPIVTWKNGITGVFLDPPYSAEAERDNNIYSEESLDVAHAVREWAIANGENQDLRIALCGYQGEHEMPASWECVAWKGHGGYANHNEIDRRKAKNNINATRERIWFSPHCLRNQGVLWTSDATMDESRET